MDMYLYQPITNGYGQQFNNKLIEARPKGHLNINMHCIGGNVYEGIAMVNGIKRERQNGTTIKNITEGVAASMGAVIACACSRHAMRKSARMMIHEITIPSTGGNAEKMLANAKMIEGFNETIAEIIAAKAGKTKEWVRENWMKPNQDTWFTAIEAMQAGLCDEILEDTDDLTNTLEGVELNALASTDLVNTFDAFFKAHNHKSNTFSMKQMTELCNIAQVEVKEGMTQDQAFTVLKAKLQAQRNELTQLRQKVEDAERAELTALLDAKGIPTKQRQNYFDIANQMGMPYATNLLGGIADIKVTLQSRKEWTYQEWQEKDPEGLLELSHREPERFQDLVKTYTNV